MTNERILIKNAGMVAKKKGEEPISQLIDLYRHKCAAGLLTSDPYQAGALTCLDAYLEQIKGSQGFWQNLWACCKRKWASLKKPQKKLRGVYLYGQVGRGKTLLMDLFFDLAPEPKIRRHFHDFLQEIHHSTHVHGFSQKEGALERVIKSYSRAYHLLCLDELEIRDIADAMILSKVLVGYQDQGMHVVITSNRHPQDLYLNGLHRERFLGTVAYIMDNFDLVNLNGPEDHRQKIKLPQEKVRYLHPCTFETQKAFERLFKDVVGASLQNGEIEVMHPPLELLEIEVWGRILTFPKQCRGVVMTTFAELCGHPHAAADYLALSRQIRCLFLDEVPKFSIVSRDEVRRLLLLVDVLYDRKVPLFLRAQDPLEALWALGPGEGAHPTWAFELMRTCSRLQEMQSWLY